MMGPKNPFHMATGLPDFNMASLNPKAPAQIGPRVGAIGVHGPWNLNPGNPDFPNHRPYLTNPKPLGEQQVLQAGKKMKGAL